MSELIAKREERLGARRTPRWIIPVFFLSVLFPVLYIVYLILVMINMIKNKGPKALYHFTKNKDSYNSIINNKILLSLAGGRLHVSNELNPYLGVKNNSKNEAGGLYAFLIDDEHEMDKFRPILNWLSLFHIWKWWKSLRGEYVFRKMKDLSFEIKDEGTSTHQILTEYGVKDITIVKIHKITPLDNKEAIQICQKFFFWFGEVVLSFLVICSSMLFLLAFTVIFLDVNLINPSVLLNIFIGFIVFIFVALPMCWRLKSLMTKKLIKSRVKSNKTTD